MGQHPGTLGHHGRNTQQEQVIEKIINLFKANNNEYDLANAIKQFEENQSEQQFFYQQIDRDYKLVNRKYNSNIFHLNEKGIAFTTFDEMRNSKRLENEGNKQLLWYNTENAKAVFEDYPNVKRNGNLTLSLSILSTIIAVISLIKSCSK